MKKLISKIFLIDDSPQKIALGFGVGVLAGILPGTGPLAALFLAWLLRLNRPAALAAGIIFNTWINVLTFIIAIKIGSAIMGLRWEAVYAQAQAVFQDFHWADFLKTAVLKIIAPLILGYFIIAVFMALTAYLIVLIILKLIRKKAK